MNIYQSLLKLCDRMKLRFKLRDEFGEQTVNFEKDTGKIRHHKNIRDAGTQLQDENLPLRKRLEAAHELGVLSYTGGYEAGTVAADYLPTLATLLLEGEQEMTEADLVTLLEALSTLCYVHLNNQTQARLLGLTHALASIVSPGNRRSTCTKMWVCYLLDVLCCSNVPMMRALERRPGFKEDLENMEAKDWSHWPRNYADVLLQVLGFKPVDASMANQD